MKKTALHDLAALDALDLLEEEERQAFAKARREQPILERQVAELRETSAQLALLAPAETPPPALRQQLLERIKQLPQTEPDRITLAPGLFLRFSDRMVWQETAIPGIKVKSLHVDPVRRIATSLVKMEPGAVYPAHRHQEIEELFMLEGDVTISGHNIKSGDFCRAEPGTIHESIRTEGGCIFMAMASLDNEFVS
jgi:anti-sigma factor ChrR (cupin superfamily)